jgi:dTDP-4-dehydrorhamnose 3,5-epimerase
MNFIAAGLEGCFIIDSEAHEDGRGDFTRFYDADEFRAHGVALPVAQCSLSRNTRRGTLRGLHFQVAPHEEAKLVRCIRGKVFDVAVDVRSHSPTFGHWIGTVLDGTGLRSLFIPEGFAHGFMTLDDATEIMYTISHSHIPSAARGLRWDDPGVGVQWPRLSVPLTISPQDYGWPPLEQLEDVTGLHNS